MGLNKILILLLLSVSVLSFAMENMEYIVNIENNGVQDAHNLIGNNNNLQDWQDKIEIFVGAAQDAEMLEGIIKNGDKPTVIKYFNNLIKKKGKLPFFERNLLSKLVEGKAWKFVIANEVVGFSFDNYIIFGCLINSEEDLILAITLAVEFFIENDADVNVRDSFGSVIDTLKYCENTILDFLSNRKSMFDKNEKIFRKKKSNKFRKIEFAVFKNNRDETLNIVGLNGARRIDSKHPDWEHIDKYPLVYAQYYLASVITQNEPEDCMEKLVQRLFPCCDPVAEQKRLKNMLDEEITKNGEYLGLCRDKGKCERLKKLYCFLGETVDKLKVYGAKRSMQSGLFDKNKRRKFSDIKIITQE